MTLPGFAFRLRPISDADASFVSELRGNTQLNRYIHASSQNRNDQLAWFACYYERPGDYYFVIERLGSNSAEGVISVYDIDHKTACGEWGRWILRPGSLAAVESAWLIYRCAFEKLELGRVLCRTVAENAPVVSFHDSCGITSRSLLHGYFDLGGERLDAVEHQVDLQSWAEIGPRMEKLAQVMARRLQHG